MRDLANRYGAADVFLETERKDYGMSGPEERRRAVELYFTTPMTTAQVVRHLGYPTRQCLERWLAKDPRYAGHMAKSSSHWRRGPRRSNQCRAACAEAGRRTARRGPQLGQDVS